MGPLSAKRYAGQQLVYAYRTPADSQTEAQQAQNADRAKQESDYGRRGKGDSFGAFRPSTGDAFTRPYCGPTIANWVDFLEQVELWLPKESDRVYAVVDNLSVHRATDVLLFCLAHPRWEFVFQPKYAAYLNLIEPWWKVLRSLALKGRRFETWEEVCQAVEAATSYWNTYKHPFIWGRRRRHRQRQAAEVTALPVTWNRRRRPYRLAGLAAVPEGA
jgi:transposase